tara:strand:+ start:139 stop:864 length:726 start_codon:yes stop_codon:yes gene_type:complete
MAIPDTNTFSLQDVVDVFVKISPQPDDLQGCFNSADGNEFDPSYVGSKDRLSNFRNYGGQWPGKFTLIFGQQLSSSSSWINQVQSLSSAYIGRDVKFVWHYISGSSYSSDLQVGGDATLGTTTFDFDTYSGTAWQTSRSNESSYSSVSWFDIATGTTDLRWNKRANSAPPSGTTGLSPPPYTGGNSTYYYAEASSNGNPSKNFWLRSPTVSITSGNQDVDYWRGNLGTTMGFLYIGVEVIT